MPTSNPLPPKESTLLKRILVRLGIVLKTTNYAVFSMMFALFTLAVTWLAMAGDSVNDKRRPIRQLQTYRYCVWITVYNFIRRKRMFTFVSVECSQTKSNWLCKRISVGSDWFGWMRFTEIYLWVMYHCWGLIARLLTTTDRPMDIECAVVCAQS